MVIDIKKNWKFYCTSFCIINKHNHKRISLKDDRKALQGGNMVNRISFLNGILYLNMHHQISIKIFPSQISVDVLIIPVHIVEVWCCNWYKHILYVFCTRECCNSPSIRNAYIVLVQLPTWEIKNRSSDSCSPQTFLIHTSYKYADSEFLAWWKCWWTTCDRNRLCWNES